MPDHQLFEFAADEFNRSQERFVGAGQSFVQCVLTVSNHPPFEFPRIFEGKITQRIVGGMKWADRSLEEFLLPILPSK